MTDMGSRQHVPIKLKASAAEIKFKDYGLHQREAVYIGRQVLAFRRNLLLLSSGQFHSTTIPFQPRKWEVADSSEKNRKLVSFGDKSAVR
jgi:hypothetical protein